MRVRIVALILCVILAGIGFEVEAQQLPHRCASTADGCDQGTAYSRCMTELAAYIATRTMLQHRNERCEAQGASGYRSMFQYLNGGVWLNGGYRNYFFVGSCSERSSLTSEFYPKSGSISCLDGCSFTWYRNVDETSTAYPNGSVCTGAQMPDSCVPGEEFWNPILSVCEPITPNCPDGQTLNSRGVCGPEECPAGMKLQADNTCGPAKEECPAGNIKAPSGECLPGEGQCAAGEARRANGTCGKDSDGDGIADVDDDDPDNDGKESASGGDTCDAPPACNGGAIDCMQVKIQWRIDCNTRRNRNVSGGSCAAMPVCTGEKCDAMEYAQLLQQWRATCALEKIAAKGDGTGGGGGDAGVVDLLTGPGSINSNAGGGDSLEDGSPWADEGEEYEPDASGYGWSRSCPSPPSFTLPGGQSVQINLTPLCNWVSLGGSLVLILAGLLSLRIVSGGNA